MGRYPDVGKLFVVTSITITNTKQRTTQSDWHASKDLLNTTKNVCTALRLLFERVIDPMYHMAKPVSYIRGCPLPLIPWARSQDTCGATVAQVWRRPYQPHGSQTGCTNHLLVL